jgi:hypothetical protein
VQSLAFLAQTDRAWPQLLKNQLHSKSPQAAIQTIFLFACRATIPEKVIDLRQRRGQRQILR